MKISNLKKLKNIENLKNWVRKKTKINSKSHVRLHEYSHISVIIKNTENFLPDPTGFQKHDLQFKFEIFFCCKKCLQSSDTKNIHHSITYCKDKICIVYRI